MNFERGRDPKQVLDIGAAKVAIKIMDLQVNGGYSTATGQTFGVSTLSKKKTHSLFKKLSERPNIPREFLAELKWKYRPRLSAPGDLVLNKQTLSWNALLDHFILYDEVLYRIPKKRGS